MGVFGLILSAAWMDASWITLYSFMERGSQKLFTGEGEREDKAARTEAPVGHVDGRGQAPLVAR